MKNGQLDRSKLDPKKLINGNEVASWYREKIREEAEDISSRIVPGLAVVLVGNRPDSATYVMAKSKFAQQCGFRVIDTHLDDDATEEEVMNAIDDLNQNPHVHGILVQLPLPSHINEQRCLKRIAIQKDVDGFSGYNIGNLTLKGGDPLAHPCTPAGVLRLLKYYKLAMSGKKCVILGRSNIVGTPLALLMLHADATVTICHSKTKDIEAECLGADIVVAALGKANYLKGHMIKEGAVVIDVGINVVKDATKKSGTRLVGDVEFDTCYPKASMITPVPGGELLLSYECLWVR